MFWSQKFDEMHFWTTSDIRCENTELINILRKFKGSFFGSHRSCKNKTRRYEWLVLNNLCYTWKYQHSSVQILCSINWYWILMPWKQLWLLCLVPRLPFLYCSVRSLLLESQHTSGSLLIGSLVEWFSNKCYLR